MTDFNQYLKNIIQQILDSYGILLKLNDDSGDLDIIKRESSKISGLFQVIANKLEQSEDNRDNIISLQKVSERYVENYDFSQEIDILSDIYFDDSARIKNIRLSIIDSLENYDTVDKLREILEKL